MTSPVQVSGNTHVLNYLVELESELLGVSPMSTGLDVYLTCRGARIKLLGHIGGECAV